MAEVRRASPAVPWLAFLLGALVVALGVTAWFILTRATHQPVDVPGVEIEGPKLPDIKMPDAPKLPTGASTLRN